MAGASAPSDAPIRLVTRSPIPTTPSTATASSSCLDERFERVEVSFYGGAVYHQLFSRIMGNFAPHPVLVRVLMEVDALLSDMDVLASDYVWGVWRRR